MPIDNPNCDGAGPHDSGEVRRFPTGGGGAAILCRRCYVTEYTWRRQRNLELATAKTGTAFDTPVWGDLEVYPTD